MRREDLALYLVTDRGLSMGRDLETVVLQAVEGGVTLVQLREKDIDTREFIALGLRLKAALAGSGVPALAVDADGVHIGQSDMPYEIARRLLGPDKIIGLSVETMDEVLQANGLDVDYVAVSPVFATKTKTDTLTPFGYEGLEQACRLTRHPICGIGGMNTDTVGRAIACGADGVAVVSAIVSAPDPRLASKKLKSIIDNELDKRRLG